MRIIAGELAGRQFEAPKTHKTHPMSERMRGGLFNTLGDLEGLTSLDCFGGSGGITFEAVSRGVTKATVVEMDATAYKTIVKNIGNLDLTDKVKAINANVSSWSDNNQDDKFSIVFCNPPFDGLKIGLIQKLARHVEINGLLVLSWPTQDYAPKIPELDLSSVREKEYGDAQLVFYRKTE